jgi:hypothetical protein
MEATAECNMSTQLIVYFSDAVIRALYVWRQYRTAAACQVARLHLRGLQKAKSMLSDLNL